MIKLSRSNIALLIVLFFSAQAIAFAASSWTEQDTYGEKITHKFGHGLKNSLLGWTNMFIEAAQPKYKTEWEGFCVGASKSVIYTAGGLVQLVTFPIPVDIPDMGKATHIPQPEKNYLQSVTTKNIPTIKAEPIPESELKKIEEEFASKPVVEESSAPVVPSSSISDSSPVPPAPKAVAAEPVKQTVDSSDGFVDAFTNEPVPDAETVNIKDLAQPIIPETAEKALPAETPSPDTALPSSVNLDELFPDKATDDTASKLDVPEDDTAAPAPTTEDLLDFDSFGADEPVEKKVTETVQKPAEKAKEVIVKKTVAESETSLSDLRSIIDDLDDLDQAPKIAPVKKSPKIIGDETA